MSETISEKLHRYIPGGAHTYSKGDDQWPAIAPSFLERGKGCFVWDGEGNQYIDWALGLGSVSLGHANEEILRSVIEALSLGNNFSRPSRIEALAAESLICFLKNRGEMVRFAKNGSTVTTAAVKLARAFTRKNKIAICGDHPFFSYDDWFIGTTACRFGIPQEIKDLTLKFSYNNLESLETLFETHPQSIACVILEPLKFEKPKNNFLQKIKTLCEKNGTLLIFDEMITGFKWHPQGAAKYYGASADLYTWGKGMANGFSVCALTGRREIMELGGITHSKPRVFLTSTTHGAEIAPLAALLKCLEIFERNGGPFEGNWKKGAYLKENLSYLLKKFELNSCVKIQGEDCLFSINVISGGIHPISVAKTYLLQELIREGQLFQGVFYPTVSHTQDILEKSLLAWTRALQAFSRFIEKGQREELLGSPIRPVFRVYNSCQCENLADCRTCQESLDNLPCL